MQKKTVPSSPHQNRSTVPPVINDSSQKHLLIKFLNSTCVLASSPLNSSINQVYFCQLVTLCFHSRVHRSVLLGCARGQKSFASLELHSQLFFLRECLQFQFVRTIDCKMCQDRHYYRVLGRSLVLKNNYISTK